MATRWESKREVCRSYIFSGRVEEEGAVPRMFDGTEEYFRFRVWCDPLVSGD